MNRKGILFVISGPSGVGKGTIKKALLRKINDIKSSISVTTRQARPGEVEAVHYFFRNIESFKQKIEQDELLEWACVYSNMYGTPRDFVAGNLSLGQDVLLEIDIQGAMQVKEKMPDAVFIFISPPSIQDLALRLCSRAKDSAESIESRLAACEDEMKHIRYYDYLVVNDDIDEALMKIQSIIVAERCKLSNLDLG